MKKFFLLLMIAIIYSCSSNSDGNGNSTTTVVPSLTTTTVSSITTNSAISGGTITSDGGASITARGVCWSTSANPTIALSTKTSNGTGIGIFTSNITGLSANTTYYVRAYATNSAGTAYGNEISFTTTVAGSNPSFITSAASIITQTSAISGGIISNSNSTVITSRGVRWSTNPISSPLFTYQNSTNDGSGTGTFTSNITGLSANTTYYVRAYYTTNNGITAYANEINFTTANQQQGPNVTDVDGNVYQSILFCNQTWTKQNLNVSKYTDGTPIPQVTNPTQWANLTTGAWCYYNNDPANGAVYGKLYNWYAIAGIYDTASLNDPSLRKKLAPIGWHIPTSIEWSTLRNCLGSNAGGKMKSTGTIQAGTGLWNDPNTGATNESDFTGLPGGLRVFGGEWATTQLPNPLGTIAWFGSSTENSSSSIQNFWLFNSTNTLSDQNNSKNNGYSIRCVKD